MSSNMNFQIFNSGKSLAANRAGVRMKDIVGVWISLSCREHSTACALGNGAKVYYQGMPMSKEEYEGMMAGGVGVWEWHLENPTRNHFFMENVGWGSLRFEEEVTQRMGEG